MSLPYGLFWCFGAWVPLAAGFIVLQGRWCRRFSALKQELTRLSEDLLQMADLQADLYHHVHRDLTKIEEKVLDMSVPSSDAPPPLERRHQVLTLARKGVALEEIARRLHIPRGEAELILSLRKYIERVPSETSSEDLKSYAQASP